jgi:hypothetical protein
VDTGYSWSEDGAEQIEEMCRDEICRPRSYPSGSGPGKQDLGRSDLRGANM